MATWPGVSGPEGKAPLAPLWGVNELTCDLCSHLCTWRGPVCTSRPGLSPAITRVPECAHHSLVCVSVCPCVFLCRRPSSTHCQEPLRCPRVPGLLATLALSAPGLPDQPGRPVTPARPAPSAGEAAARAAPGLALRFLECLPFLENRGSLRSMCPAESNVRGVSTWMDRWTDTDRVSAPFFAGCRAHCPRVRCPLPRPGAGRGRGQEADPASLSWTCLESHCQMWFLWSPRATLPNLNPALNSMASLDVWNSLASALRGE